MHTVGGISVSVKHHDVRSGKTTIRTDVRIQTCTRRSRVTTQHDRRRRAEGDRGWSRRRGPRGGSGRRTVGKSDGGGRRGIVSVTRRGGPVVTRAWLASLRNSRRGCDGTATRSRVEVVAAAAAAACAYGNACQKSTPRAPDVVTDDDLGRWFRVSRARPTRLGGGDDCRQNTTPRPAPLPFYRSPRRREFRCRVAEPRNRRPVRSERLGPQRLRRDTTDFPTGGECRRLPRGTARSEGRQIRVTHLRKHIT